MKQFNLFYFYLIYFIFFAITMALFLELIMYLDLQCSENVNTKIVPEKLDNIHSLNENISSSVEEPIPDQRSSSKEEKDEDEDLTDLVVCAHAIVVGLIFYTDPWTGTIVLLFYLLFVPLPSIF